MVFVNVNCRLVGPFRMSFQLFGHVGQTALRHFVDEGFDISLVNARHFQHHILELRIFFDEAFDVFLFGAGTDGNLFSASVFIGQRIAVFVPGLKQLGKTKPLLRGTMVEHQVFEIVNVHFRKEFAFEKWNDFDQELFDTIYNDDSQEREFTHKVYGYDNNPKANEIATHNVKAAGLSKEVILKIQPFQQFEQPKEKSIIITNPPYGERISTNDLLGLYQMIGERLKHAFAGNDAWILSYREECFDQIGLKPSVKVPLFNGALECEFRKYQLFDGKYKEFRTENKDRDFKPRREDTRPRRNSERVEYGERRERRNFDDKREGRGDFKNRDRKDRGNEERKEFKPRFKREEK